MNRLLLSLAILNLGFAQAQIENGMVAHFPLNGNLNDISTSSILATNNSCTFVSDRNGIAGDAIGFNSTGYVSFTDNSLKQQFPISVSYWVKLNSLAEVNVLFKTDNVFENYYGVSMNNLPSGGLTISFGGGLGGANSSNQRYFTTNNITMVAGTWHHVVGIINSVNDMEIYLDCVKATGTYGGTGSTSVAYSSNGDSRLGGSIGNNIHPTNFMMDGSMDQFAFWNRELTPSEITYLCDTNNALSIPELSNQKKELVKIIDLMGREINETENTPMIYIYSDGSTERIFLFK